MQYSLPPLSLLRSTRDVDMADTAFSTTPVAGKKRSRDDGDDTDELGRAFDYMPRLEKVNSPKDDSTY